AAAGLGAGGAVGVGADRMAGRVAGAGLVALGAELGAQGQGVVGVVADEATAEVEVRQGLGEAVVADAEAGGAVRAQRGSERVGQAEGEVVGAVVEAGVVVPLAQLAARAGDQGHVQVLAHRNRAEAVRIDLLPVGRALGIAVVVGAFGIALV